MPDTARTITATLEKHKISIQEADLSRTFQDFIGIARRLGIQHVWIDSLCIIQDDGADWEKEASQMASVYSNAYLTIAASSSADGNGGCAVWDSERSVGPLDVDCIPVEADFAPATANYKFRVWTRNPSPTGISNDPLQTRGWTLQERELSPRVVNYCKDTIRWECQSLHASLEFPWDDSLSFNGDHRHFDAEQSIFLPMPGVNRSSNLPTDPRTETAVSWMELVVKYTSRRLTKDSDKLPAISGIARTIAERTSDEYFAGLWKSYFQQCLLWQCDRNTEDDLQNTKPLYKTAPSWSWASINGKVSWPLGNLYNYNPDPDPEFIPKILNIHIDPLGFDPYGMLKQGILHIEGKVATVYSLPEAENSAQHRKLRSPLTREEIGHINYDIPLGTDGGKPNIVFLLCCLNEKKREDMDLWTFALALQPVLDVADGIPGTVRRVGLASRILPEFWENNSTWMKLKVC
ncbi:Heterokaryon incompatibility protein [Rutstroemia sp. NJR-2017a BBW]|nr:Heterokaryon incompatibility protein [Rutstroemia sp. NJR-2017a BBW]